jgi:predicted nuclease of predicted toxin-antitoxin system
LKLLLDAMFAPAIAEQLRRRAHDVVAAAEVPEFRYLGDPDLFAAAQAEQRAVVTNNVDHFLAIDAVYREQRRLHYGLILTSDRRFRRAQGGGIGPLVLALDAFLSARPPGSRADSLVHWLQ